MSRVRIVEGATNILTKGEHNIYSEGNINISSLKSVNLQGEESGIHYGDNPGFAPDIAPGLTEACVVYFRPMKNYSGNISGIDWMRLGERGDVNFEKTIGEYIGVGDQRSFVKKAQKLEMLGREYNPLTIRDSAGEALGKYYSAWVSLYPENTCDSAASEIYLALDIKAKEKLDKPVRFVCDNPKLFDFTQEIPPIGKKSEYLNKENNAFRIKCLTGFDKVQEVRAYIDLDETDADGKPKQLLVGRFYVLPNDNDHRYKVKVQLVKIILTNRDTPFLLDKVNDKMFDIETWLQNKLHPLLIRPIVEDTIDEIDLRTEFARGDYDGYTMDNRNQATFGSDEKVLSDSGSSQWYNEIGTAYYKRLNSEAEVAARNTINAERAANGQPALAADAYVPYDPPLANTLVIYFLNMPVANSDTDSSMAGMIKGRANTPGSSIFIYKDGINERTLTHESLHSMGVPHPFDDDSKYIFEQSKTDNLMDYYNNEEYSYKWQWDIVWESRGNMLEKEAE